MKTIKRTLAVLLTLLMLISAVPLGMMNASATDSPVKTILDRVESVYSAGTYFTANRKACNHSSTSTCNNCKLAYILDSADCKTIKRYSNGTYNANTWTCFSFVSFCFTQCFGKMYVKDNYTKTIDSNDLFSADITDFSNQSVATKKKFFSYGKIGDIIKCFTYDGEWHHKHSMVFISADDTGVTVFDANVGGNSSHTGTVRKARLKYENIKHFNMEILHAKNYNSVVGYTTMTFNGNGGTPSKASEDFIPGERFGSTLPSATRNGYSFDGWYSAASGGSRYRIDDIVPSNVKTLYAHWSKNNTDVLAEGRIYKIYNKYSGLPLQVNNSSSGSYICQQTEASTTSQLWRVTYTDGNGYYEIESLNGCNLITMDGNPKVAYWKYLQIGAPNHNDTQKFSLVERVYENGTGYYTIHSKNSGLALQVEGASKDPGAKIFQTSLHNGDSQRFCFDEQTERRVFFFDNLNNNYLPSPKEVYNAIGLTTPNNHYSSRDESYVTVAINPTEDSLTIKQLKAGSTTQGAIAGDMKWLTTLNGSYTYDVCELDDSTMTLHFKAKSSVSGAKMYFRWGYTTTWYSVTLTNSWADYSLDLPRDRASGNNLHPLIDKACTVEVKEISLFNKGESGYIGDTDTYSVVRKDSDIYDGTSCYTPLPTRTKEGYTFEGWYTKRVGGTKVAEGNDYYDVASLSGHTNLYAHWIKNITHVHEYDATVKAPTCTEQGYTTYVCSICGDSYSTNYISAVGHDYIATAKEATCTQRGYRTYTCNDCGDTYIDNEVNPLGHNYIETYVPETCIKDGYLQYQCSRCEESFKEIISATGHPDKNDDGYCDLCEKELRPHDDSTNPTSPTNPTEQTTQSHSQPQNVCKWCGKVHEGFFQKIIGFFHNILAAILGAKY